MPGRHVVRVTAAAQDDRLGARLEIEHRDLGGVQAAGDGGHCEEDTATAWQDLRPEMIGLARSRSGRVTTVGFAAAAETRCSPVAGLSVAKMIVSSEAHVAPRGPPSRAVSVTGGPPVIATFFSVRVVEKPDPLPVRSHEDTAD